MDVVQISDSCVKITLSANQAKELGISFDSFEKDNHDTKAFLTYTLALIADMNILTLQSSSLSIEVYEQHDESLIIYIISNKPKQQQNSNLAIALIVDEPRSFFDIVPKVKIAMEDKILSSQLFLYNQKYVLVINLNCSKSTAYKKLYQISTYVSNKITIEKIREYGKLISDSPITLFI